MENESDDKSSKSFKYLKILESVDGSEVNLPYVLITGKEHGPRLYLGAALHGDEINGVFAISEIINKIEPTKLKGSILAVPVQNPPAFKARRRKAPQGIPVDELDVNDVFPGKLDGKPAEIIAFNLFHKLMKTSDYAIDLHTGTSFQEVCKTFTPSNMFGEVSREALEMAKVFGIRLIYEGMYDEGAWFENILAKRGIPALGVELGQGSSLQEKYVERGVEGILNVLGYLGMLKGAFPLTEDLVLIHREVDVRAKSGGLIKMKTRVWDEVSKGDIIASIYSPVGQDVQYVEASIDGYVNNILTIPTVSVGERIATIGSS